MRSQAAAPTPVTTWLALVSSEYHYTGTDHSVEHQEKHKNAEDPGTLGFGHIIAN